MKNKRFMAYALTCLFLSSSLLAAELPDKMDLVYRANVAGMDIGTLNRQLQASGNGMYKVTSETRAQGIAAMLMNDTYREQSEFKIDNGMIYPLRYHQAPDKKPEKARIATFDWDKKKVSLNNDRIYDIKPGVQDPASFLFYWMLSPPVQGQEGKISLVDGKRMKQYQYNIIGEEKLASLWGEINTLQIERRDNDDPEKILRLWLAVDRNHVPVKLENVRPNYKMTFTLEKAEGL